jgi:hypothetical protein
MLRLLAIGCNYPGEAYSLPDCEMDANSLAKTFAPYVGSARTLLSRQATHAGMLRAVRAFLDSLRAGDLGLLSFSGHGTNEKISGKYVQAIVANDGKVFYEHELRQILNDRPEGTILGMLSDSCHSGGLPRGHIGNSRKPRTVPVRLVTPHDTKVPAKAPPRPNFEYLASKAEEYAYSTGEGGAMTRAFCECFAKRGGRTTLRSLHQGIRTLLPNKEWPQTPQFVCRDAALAKRTIRSFVK